MKADEWLLICLSFSSLGMICVAILGYGVAQLFSEIYASKKQSPAKTHGSGSGAGPVWEVNSCLLYTSPSPRD